MPVKYYTTADFELNLCGIIPGLVDETARVLSDILKIYNATGQDPDLRAHAFTITTNYVSKILSVNQRTAELLVETAIDEGVKNGH